MRLVGILVIAFIVAIVAAAAVFSANIQDSPNSIIDKVEPKDEASMGIGSDALNAPRIEDDAKVAQERDPDYTIDEEGKKHYVIKVEDKPGLG